MQETLASLTWKGLADGFLGTNMRVLQLLEQFSELEK